MTKLFLALCMSACLAVSLPVSEALAQPGSASKTKKKKCKKGYKLTTVKKGKKKRKICKKQKSNNGGGGGGGNNGGGGGGTADPNAAAQALISGQGFYRAFSTQSTSGEEKWTFCANGTYFRLYNSSFFGGGGTSTFTEYNNKGTWAFSKAAAGNANGVAGFEAEVLLTGTYDDKQVSSGPLRLLVSGQTTQSGINDGNGYKEYQRSAAGC